MLQIVTTSNFIQNFTNLKQITSFELDKQNTMQKLKLF